MQTDGIASPAEAASPAVRPHEPLPVDPPSHQGATADPVTPTPNPTVVRSAEELQAATLAGAVNIEIHDHIDLRGLSLAVNPDISGPDIHTFIKRLALMYATAHTRSIRVLHFRLFPCSLSPDVASDSGIPRPACASSGAVADARLGLV